MRPVLRHLAALLVLLLAAGCHKASPPPTAPVPNARAFYFWRTTFSLSPKEQAALAASKVKRLYVRAFDVALGKDGKTPQPIAPLGVEKGARVPEGVEVVPVVFLREAVFRAEMPKLAQHVWAETQEIARRLKVKPRQLQLDCDWTDASRANYFKFLKALGELAHPAGVALSATLRLHQVKFRERTGVPPVSRAMLMFYNMGRIGPSADDHAIFDAKVASQYLARLPDYPLPMDVALPIWSWVVRVEDGQVRELLQSVDPSELRDNRGFTPVGKERWRVARDQFLHGLFLRKGEELQAETVRPEASLEAAKLLDGHLLPAPGRTVALFQLSDDNLERHDAASLEQLFTAVP